MHADCPDCPFFESRSELLEVCSECGTGRTRQRTASADAQDYLSKTPGALRWRQAYARQLCDRLLGSLVPGRALDVGCGSGQLLDELERRGWVASGIEPFAEAAHDPRIQITTLADYARSSGASQSFDLVTLVHAFEHLPDPRGAIGQINDLLRPGGHVAIVVPNFGGHWARAAGVEWHWLNPDEHCFHYTAQGLCQLVQAAGLDVVRRYTRSDASAVTLSAWLGRMRAYERFPLRHPPLRGTVFRLARVSQRPVAWISDRLFAGAELVILCRRRTDEA